jgi:hypothetical protein
MIAEFYREYCLEAENKYERLSVIHPFIEDRGDRRTLTPGPLRWKSNRKPHGHRKRSVRLAQILREYFMPIAFGSRRNFATAEEVGSDPNSVSDM